MLSSIRKAPPSSGRDQDQEVKKKEKPPLAEYGERKVIVEQF